MRRNLRREETFNPPKISRKRTDLKVGHYESRKCGECSEHDRSTAHLMYLPIMAARRFLVAAGTSLGSVMSAWARALPHLHSCSTGSAFTASRKTRWAFSAF